MNLLGILAQYKIVRDDLAGGNYLQAWQDTLPLQQGMIDLGKSFGFRGSPTDAATCGHIVTCAEECVDFCESVVPTVGAVSAFDWKALVKSMLLALLDAWKNNQQQEQP